jgi:hypothetical protein
MRAIDERHMQSRAKGHQKKTERPRTSTEPIQKALTHLLLFFPPTCFFSHFQALLSKWSSKTPKNLFKKPMSKMFYKKMRKILFRFFLGERAAERLDFDRSDLQKWNPR